MRGGNVAGLVIATVCGVATAYTTLQPALEEEAEKKAGTFNSRQEKDRTAKDTQLSRAIISDLKEAKREVIGEDKGNGGFAWGIRRWLAGEDKRNEK
ncbi:uncharacterized protein SEPMUDRAFT_57227 [Sphaerulina musiva SO2202]|uniref:Uncharacterized protein n=1 Tax=Sphaerulina musiva (strain SO2202) TaxID=692275 RepID=N1QIV6_SPHMS|nr:uncharacterized protein SEPMUDRAFT_57227 [Sphaerulina musiva SO2202]EMF17130.1 hypothetical protein SEPMUDRAFT_57227 [Sphaerulina musiva SO2202]